jgi:hypothetical protein
MAADVSSLLKTLASYERRIALLERNQRVNNIGNASIEGGTLTVTDGAGNTQLALGLQPDGTYAAVASSPTAPLPPSAPVMADTALGVSVAWDGNMADGSTPLADFIHVQVHLSPAPGFTPSAATLHATMTAPGLVKVSSLLASTTYYGVLVALNASGNPSLPSAYASAMSTAISAQHVAANAFGLNMIADPQFTNPTLNASRAADAATLGSWSFSATAGEAVSDAVTGTAQLALMPSASPPVWVSPGEQYYLSCTFTVTGSCTLNASLVTNSSTVSVSQAVTAGTWTIAGIVTVPSGASSAYFRVSAVSVTSNITTVSVPVMQPASLFSPTIFGEDYIISPAGSFFYSAAPAHGDLIASTAAAGGSDEGFTNPYKAGTVVYGTGGNASYVQMLAGTPAAMNLGTGDAAESGPGQVTTTIVGSGPTRTLVTRVFAPRVTGEAGGALTELRLSSPSADLSVGPSFQVLCSDGTSAADVLVTPTQWRLGAIDPQQADPTLHSFTNPLTGVTNSITKGWVIPANDANNGTIYCIEVPFDGVWQASGALNIGFSINGVFTNLVPIATAMASAGNNYAGVFRVYFQVLTTGSSGTCNIWGSGEAANASANRIGTTGAPLNGINNGHAINTTIANTITVAVNFSVSSASQTINGRGSIFRRIGQ